MSHIIRAVNTISKKNPIRSSLRLAEEYVSVMDPGFKKTEMNVVSKSVPYPTPYYLTGGGNHNYNFKSRVSYSPPRSGVPIWRP